MAQIDDILKGARERWHFWQERNARFKRTFDVLTMVDKNAVPGYESTVIADLRAGFGMGTHILSANEPRHRLPTSLAPSEDVGERERKARAERLLHGNWRVVDQRFLRSGRERPQKELAAWCLSTGWYALFRQVRILPSGAPDFVLDVWDPSEVYPEWGGLDLGLVQLDRQYRTVLGEFRARAQVNGWNVAGLSGDASQAVLVLDHWETRRNRLDEARPDVLNAVVIQDVGSGGSLVEPSSGKLVKQLTREPDLVEIPALIGVVNGMPRPSVYFTDPKVSAAYLGQSMLEAALIAYDTLNRLWKYVLQDVKQAAMRVYTHKSLGAQGGITEEDLNRALQVLNLDLREELQKLDQTTSVNSAALLFDMLLQQIQRAVFPWTQYGQTNLELSGIAIDKLNEQSRAVLGPSLRAMEHAYAEVDLAWLSDWVRLAKDGKVKEPVRVVGRIRGTPNGGFYDEQVAVEDLPESHYVDVSLTPALPMDVMMKAATARQIIPQGNLQDKEWVLDELFAEQDPLMRMRRIAEEEVHDLPAWKAMNGIRRMRQEMAAAAERGDQFEAEMWQTAIDSTVAAMQAPPGEGIPTRPGVPSPALGPMFGNGRAAPPGQPGRVARPGEGASPLERTV